MEHLKSDVAFLYEDSLREAANQRGENYWYAYVDQAAKNEAENGIAYTSPRRCRITGAAPFASLAGSSTRWSRPSDPADIFVAAAGRATLG